MGSIVSAQESLLYHEIQNAKSKNDFKVVSSAFIRDKENKNILEHFINPEEVCFLRYDQSTAKNLSNTTTLTIPLKNKELQLELLEVSSSFYDYEIVTDDGQRYPANKNIRHYRGIVKNDPTSIVAITFCDDEVIGLVATDEGNCPRPDIPSNGGTIMSYCHQQSAGINFNLGFGFQPGNVIRNSVNNASCLLFISGPTTVCYQATYNTNLPSGATVLWSTSNNNLTLISEQGKESATFQKIRDGVDRIQARITHNNNTIDLAPLNVYIGGPAIPRIEGPQRPPNGQESRYEAILDDGAPTPTNYEWILNPQGRNSVYPSGRFVYIAFYDAGTYQLICRATNNCGVGEYSVITLNVFNNPNSNAMEISLFPNPATDMVTVKLQMEQPQGDGISTQRTTLPVSTGPYEIQLWSSSAMLRRFTTDQPVYQISVSGLHAGNYFVRVIKDGKTITKKLIKR